MPIPLELPVQAVEEAAPAPHLVPALHLVEAPQLTLTEALVATLAVEEAPQAEAPQAEAPQVEAPQVEATLTVDQVIQAADQVIQALDLAPVATLSMMLSQPLKCVTQSSILISTKVPSRQRPKLWWHWKQCALP